jgi:hypothetical protein
MSDSPKGPIKHLALQLVPVVPDGTPRIAAPQPQAACIPEPMSPAHAALWFDDPDTRYILH